MIDLRTFLTLFAVADLLAAAALWIGVGRGSREGLSLWACGLVLRAVAAALCVAGVAHADGALAVAAGLLAGSGTLQAAALANFVSRPFPAWIHSAALAAIAVPVQLAERDVGMTVIFMGVAIGVLLLGAAAVARETLPDSAPKRLLAGSLVV